LKPGSFIKTFDVGAYAQGIVSSNSAISQIADSEDRHPIRIINPRLNYSVGNALVHEVALKRLIALNLGRHP
jgi:hypothetical protein